MRRLKFLVPLTALLLGSAAPSIADQEPYCTFPEVDPVQRSWHEINLNDLGIPGLLPDVDHDINLFVEQELWDNYSYPGGIVDLSHLRNFITGIWRSDTDNDIRTVWNYFAAHGPRVPDLPEYGQFGTTEYNFKYPDLPDTWLYHRNKTEVNIRLVVGIRGVGQCLGNTVSIDLSAHRDSVVYVPDWWYAGEWAGRTFVHEFQHTIGACFEPGYPQGETGEYFKEGFCEAAVAIAGYSKTMVGYPHTDQHWPRYDLIYNNGVEESRTNLVYAYQSESSAYAGNKYTGGFLWSAYIADQFPGAAPNDITDDLLYQALRIVDGGEMEEGMRAFALAAADYSAWGYQNDPALFHEIFRRWTLANLLDGTSVDPTLTYPNHTVRIRYETDAGVGWLRDNEDPYCNDHPLPIHPGQDDGCGNWYPPTLVIPDLWQPQTYDTEAQESACSWDPYVGVELYAADYVGFVPGWSFPSGTILSLAFDVHDDDMNWNSNNILMSCHAVSYGADENDPLTVESVDMGQSDFPVYAGKLYHHIDGFGTDVSLVHTVVSAMEAVPLASGQYPMRSYAITATAVSVTIFVSGTLNQNTTWYSGQTVEVSGQLTVASNATLTIEPGVTVRLGPAAHVAVLGTLEAVGNAVLPITFTSAAAQASPGNWVGIHTSGLSGKLIVRDCQVEYAQKGLAIANSQPHEIQNNQLRHCSQAGLWIQKMSGDPGTITEPVTGNAFWANDYGVYLDGVTVTEFRGNSFDGNVVGMYMNQSWISNGDGFRDLTFTDNDVGLKVETPSGETSTLKYSSFSGNADCAIYYNRNAGAGDLELQDLFIEDQVPALNAGIRVLGSNSEPVVRDCHIHSFAGGPLAPNKGITCMSMGRVDAGTAGSPGGNRFEGNECDIEYTNRGYNPQWLHAVGNCWGTGGDDPVFCGNQIARILWEPIDCSGWGGSPVPPRPGEETVAGLVGVFPNPGEGSFRIAYGLAVSERLKVQIYDLSGRLVGTVVESEMPAGTHEAEWDGTDAQGRAVGKGVYVCRIVGESFVESKRLVVMR